MRSQALIVLAVVLLGLHSFVECSSLPEPGTCGVDFSDRIYGGTITTPKAYPWTAILVYRLNRLKDLYWCGGSLISDRYVLTAAHCVNSLNEDYELQSVRLGEWDLESEEDCNDIEECNDPPLSVGVEKVIPHADFSMVTTYNDIALVKLNESVNYTEFVSPVCLPVAEPVKTLDTDGLRFMAAGWGNTEHKNDTTQYGSRYKLHVQLNAVNKTFCDVVYPRGVASSQLCAGAEAGKSSCHGDSGGALVATVDGYAYGYGIVSYGRACGKEHIPVVYTRVTSFLDWIEENMD
ncbi:proclotting enzyme [Culex quinquefasciatus]|uniref:Proclotting enzyme n=1 Tax=Culex quinquefasciatus TaxID=7176 RepID=B0WJK1_CULQU|nr:proclotting enzyme [Culex quinquefasciatus]|eukprot:XP_001848885.1 proclotting enzyme [Culex quinquefasciatus]